MYMVKIVATFTDSRGNLSIMIFDGRFVINIIEADQPFPYPIILYPEWADGQNEVYDGSLADE